MRASFAFTRRSPLRSCFAFAFLAFVALSGACKRGGAGGGGEAFPLVPVSRGHESLVGTLTWPSVDGTFADVGAVAKKMGLPFSGEDAKASLLTQAPFKGALNQIDLAKPVSLVFLAEAPSAGGDAGKGEKFSGLAAFAPKAGAPTTVEGWAKTLGTVIEKRQDAVAVRASDDAGAANIPRDTFYLLVRDGAVLVADSWKSLEEGGALALAARSGSTKIPTLSLRPEGLARQQGTTLAAALDKARTEMKKGLATSGERPAPPVVQSMMEGMMDLVFGWVQSTEALEISASLNDRDGLALTMGLRPTSGSKLAQLVASSKPYVAEPALLAGERPALFAAVGESGWLKEFMPLIRKTLESIPGEQASQAKKDEIRRLVDLMGEAWSGAGTVAFRAQEGLSYDIVYGIDPAKGASLTEALGKVLGPSPFGDLGTIDPSFAGTSFVLEKDGDTFWGHFVSAKGGGKSAKKKGAAPAAAMSFLSNLELRMVLEGGKMIAATGPGNKARFESLRAAVKATPAATPNPDLAAALAATKDSLFVEHIDIGGFLKGVAAMAAQPGFGGNPASAQQTAAMASMLGDSHLSLFVDGKGGDALSFTLHVPMETAASGAMLSMRMMGGMGGPGAPPPSLAVPPPSAPRKRGKH